MSAGSRYIQNLYTLLHSTCEAEPARIKPQKGDRKRAPQKSKYIIYSMATLLLYILCLYIVLFKGSGNIALQFTNFRPK